MAPAVSLIDSFRDLWKFWGEGVLKTKKIRKKVWNYTGVFRGGEGAFNLITPSWIGYFNTIPEKTARDLKGFYVNLFLKAKSKTRFFWCNSSHVLKFSKFWSTLKHALTKIVVIFAQGKSKFCNDMASCRY